MSAAGLRLPQWMHKEKAKRVENVLLKDCADVLVGDELEPGVCL